MKSYIKKSLDIWKLGILIYEIFERKKPFNEEIITDELDNKN